jgi:hypothetical protein
MQRFTLPVMVFTAVLSLQAAYAYTAVSEDAGRFSARDIRSDFKELYQNLRAAHYNLYANTPKREFDRLYRSYLSGLDRPMAPLEVKALFQRFAASSRVAHCNINFLMEELSAYQQNGGRSMPLSIRVKEGKTYIVENYSGSDGISAGDELVSIDGKDMSVWLPRLMRNLSADNDYLAHALLEFQFPALLWLELGPAERFELGVRKGDGGINRVTVPALTGQQIQSIAAENPKPPAVDWHGREARMLEDGIAYLRPGVFMNLEAGAVNILDNSAFSKFIDDSFESFIEAGAKALLIDLRNNPGGDNSFSDLMMSWIADKPFKFAADFRIKASRQAVAANNARLHLVPDDPTHPVRQLARGYASHKIGDVFSFDLSSTQPRAGRRFERRVFMLINRHSHSNSANVAALAQDYGFATVLGEATSDLVTTYGAMEHFKLPKTGILVGFPKAHIIRPRGDARPSGVMPDIEIEDPVVTTARDAMLDEAIRIVHSKI